jgi:hypothetical protein
MEEAKPTPVKKYHEGEEAAQRFIHVVNALLRPLRERFRNEIRNGARDANIGTRVSYGNLSSFMVEFAL